MSFGSVSLTSCERANVKEVGCLSPSPILALGVSISFDLSVLSHALSAVPRCSLSLSLSLRLCLPLFANIALSLSLSLPLTGTMSRKHFRSAGHGSLPSYEHRDEKREEI